MDNNVSIRTIPAHPQMLTGSILWTYGAFILMGIVIPGVLFFSVQGEFSANVLLMLCIVIWCQLRLAYTGLTGQRRLTLLCFYVFVYVFLGLQPLLSISKNTFPIDIYLSDEVVTFTGLLVILGIIAFEMGYKLRFRKVGAARIHTCPSKNLSLSTLWATNVVASLLTVLVMMYYGPGIFIGLRDYGGISPFWVRNVDFVELLLVTYGIRVLAAVLLFFAVYLWKMRKRLALTGNRVLSLRFALLFLGLLNLIVSNPLSAPRLWSGSLLLTVVFISMRWRGARSFSIITTLSCLTLLMLFSGLDPRHLAHQLTRNESTALPTIGLFITDAFDRLPTDATFDAFTMLASTTQYTDKFGYSWGSQLLLPALFWVPRSIWNSKPVGTPDMVAGFLDLFSLNVSSPLWAEGYVNFGVLGLFIFLFFFGQLARISDNFLVLTTGVTVPVLQTIISSYFAANTFILLRGDLTSGTMYLQLVVLFSFSIIFLNRCLKSPAKNSPPVFMKLPKGKL